MFRSVRIVNFKTFKDSSLIKSCLQRTLSAQNKTESDKMVEILRMKFPLASKLDVTDISGGCGAMYEIHVESIELKGMPIVKQHRLVTDVLKENIQQMHGLRIHTTIPKT